MILNFASINKKIKIINIIMVLILGLILCQKVFSEPMISKHTLVQNKDKTFNLKVFDEKNKVVYQEKFEKEPYVEVLKKQVVLIKISVGSSQNYTYFYDIVTKKTSGVYDNALLIKDGKVIYLIEDKLIISDYMRTKKYLSKKLKDLANTAVPASAILSVKSLNKNKVEVVYYDHNFDEIVEYFQW